MPEIVKQIIEVCVIPLLGVLVAFACNWLKQKASELAIKSQNELAAKYINLAASLVTTCVETTNQTYVDSLKASGSFDGEAQKAAFEKTKTAVMALLTDEAQTVLNSVVGDVESYITQQIEAAVKASK